MSRRVCNVCDEASSGKRLDVFCADVGAYASRSAAAKAIAAGSVLVNGKEASKKHIVEQGDVVICDIEDEVFSSELQGQDIPLDIRYEDDDIIVLSKQAGLICHPANEYKDNTLVNALIHRYGINGLCDVQGESDRYGIVHRLDSDTSGLMLAAKTNEAGLALMDQIGNREVDRHYMALVHGIIAPDNGLIDVPIMRNPRDRKTMSAGDGPSSREAITTFNVIERFEGDGVSDGYTLIECKLYTGRTHQIRVHMQYIGHPIVGDPTYNAKGPKSPKAQLGLNRQFLHSYKLGFMHPITEEKMYFEDELPDDLAEALDSIKG